MSESEDLTGLGDPSLRSGQALSGLGFLADRLVAAARTAREQAYAPYSRFPVGAALLTASGEVFTGANVENAAYPSSMCAERVAVFKAVTAGQCDLRAIAVVSETGATPCGACRQVLQEFNAQPGQADQFVVIVANTHEERQVFTLAELLPAGFTAEKLL